jgi:ABC-2 type transport system permease protein
VLLGGIFLPTDQLPAGLEAISGWLPLTYAIDALNAVATGDEDAEWIAMKLLVVVAWIIGSIVLGSITLRRRTP